MTTASRARTPTQSPGETIRAFRKTLGLTLGDVGQRTGLSVSTLSKLEQGKASLSYDKLTSIAKGLGVEVAALLAAPSAASTPRAAQTRARRVIQQRGDGLCIETRTYKQLYLATELLHKRFVPVMVELKVRSLDEFVQEYGGMIRHAGEEFCLVLEGEVDFHSEIYAPARLRVGDSLYFDSDMAHAYLAALDTPCRILSICASEDPAQSQKLIDNFTDILPKP